MQNHAVRHLLVVDGPDVVGIVSDRDLGGRKAAAGRDRTVADLLELIGRGVERPIERSTRWTLRSRGARGTGPTARHSRQG